MSKLWEEGTSLEESYWIAPIANTSVLVGILSRLRLEQSTGRMTWVMPKGAWNLLDTGLTGEK